MGTRVDGVNLVAIVGHRLVTSGPQATSGLRLAISGLQVVTSGLLVASLMANLMASLMARAGLQVASLMARARGGLQAAKATLHMVKGRSEEWRRRFCRLSCCYLELVAVLEPVFC